MKSPLRLNLTAKQQWCNPYLATFDCEPKLTLFLTSKLVFIRYKVVETKDNRAVQNHRVQFKQKGEIHFAVKTIILRTLKPISWDGDASMS